MNALMEYLDMGGYARYVWPAYIIVIGAIASNVIMARRALRRAREAAVRRLAMKAPSAEAPMQAGASQTGNSP
jgi:heme exporter protein CcmD